LPLDTFKFGHERVSAHWDPIGIDRWSLRGSWATSNSAHRREAFRLWDFTRATPEEATHG